MRPPNPNKRDANGWTQVYHGAYRLDARRCVLWLGRGANPNLRVRGLTALHQAVSTPHLEKWNDEAATTIVNALLDHGAELEAEMLGNTGMPPEVKTPLECAIYCNNSAMVKLLLTKRAYITDEVRGGLLRENDNKEAYEIIDAVLDGGGYASFTRAHRLFLRLVLHARDYPALPADSVGDVLGFLSPFDGMDL
jgi:ankyrin repeat protein